MSKKNRSRFFIRSSNFSNFFLSILFVLTFLLIFFNKSEYFLINKFKSLSTEAINPISKFITSPIKITFNAINSINDLRFVKKENLRLKEEVVRLKKWQTLAIKNSRENNAFKKLLNSTTLDTNVIKTAVVTNQSPNMYAKVITINAGKKHQLEEDFSVINERGLVGKILSVSNNYSKILLINDQNSSVPVKLMNKDFFAIMNGRSDGKYLISSFIKEDKMPNIGDILVTSGNANIYPKDILVGKIVSINDHNFLALPYVNLQNIEFVQIIDNK